MSLVSYARPTEMVSTVSNLAGNKRFTIQRVVMPALAGATVTNRLMELDYYLPVGKERVPVIVVLPIIGGGYPAEKHFCAYFARHGMAAILVRREGLKKTIGHLDEINDALLHAAIDARQAIDWIETRPELDASRIGVFGISMGGIRAAFLAPLDKRIRASVVGLAGGDLPYIITHSTERGLERRRNDYMGRNQLTEEEFETGLRNFISCDPLAVAGAIDPGRVLMVLAAFDRAVPIRKGLELRRAMGRPETIFTPVGHYTSLLFIPYIKPACLRFFREKFRD